MYRYIKNKGNVLNIPFITQVYRIEENREGKNITKITGWWYT